MKKKVAPYTGAWIEMLDLKVRLNVISVAPYTGAWIEIKECCTVSV